MMSAFFHKLFKRWQLGVSLSAAALRAAADKLTPKNNRNATAQTAKSNRRSQTSGTRKTRSDRKARREKASALTRLRIAFFPRGGRAFVAELRYVLFVIPPFFPRYCG